MGIDIWTHWFSFLTASIALPMAFLRAGYWIADRRHTSAANQLKRQQDQSVFTPSYTAEELAEAFRGYVHPDCGQADPSHEGDFRHVADIREPVFKSLDRLLDQHKRARHFLILADSGMGKTSLCLNYYRHRRRSRHASVALVSLARPGALGNIIAVANKRDTLLIIDALDEDADAQRDVQERLTEILDTAADYKAVVITCRSQFFRDAKSIPQDTGVSVITPRGAGNGGTYSLWHLYLMPFSNKQISLYLSKQFPIWDPRSLPRRRAARRLVDRVPELSSRPMLLELVPDLIRERAEARELFDLYVHMVDSWAIREQRWISQKSLLAVSKEIAIMVHRQASAGRGDRIDRTTLNRIAESVEAGNAQWEHLSTRSLLNRDNDGLIKFAHRSIMEYFFVLAAIGGDVRCFDMPWTDMMRELLVSWGYTATGGKELERAKILLRRDLTATKLSPLSDPPAEPGLITIDNVAAAATRRTARSGARRMINSRWRAESIKLVEARDGIRIIDHDCNLQWLLPDQGGDWNEGEHFQQPLARRLSIEDAGWDYRAPSYEEVVTLVEALASLGHQNLLGLNRLFLLGDKLGRQRHLLVELHTTSSIHGHLHAVDRGRQIEGTGARITLYEVSRFRDPAQLQNVRVGTLGVKLIDQE